MRWIVWYIPVFGFDILIIIEFTPSDFEADAGSGKGISDLNMLTTLKKRGA